MREAYATGAYFSDRINFVENSYYKDEINKEEAYPEDRTKINMRSALVIENLLKGLI